MGKLYLFLFFQRGRSLNINQSIKKGKCLPRDQTQNPLLPSASSELLLLLGEKVLDAFFFFSFRTVLARLLMGPIQGLIRLFISAM